MTSAEEEMEKVPLAFSSPVGSGGFIPSTSHQRPSVDLALGSVPVLLLSLVIREQVLLSIPHKLASSQFFPPPWSPSPLPTHPDSLLALVVY